VENQLIDGRFRIIREVARGAMGIVYEAFDETLERRIAIKCAQLGFHKRLPPEVRNSREITHPNVCKIFDLHNATTSEGKINFITMEFLEGETLAQRLERGRLSEEEAPPGTTVMRRAGGGASKPRYSWRLESKQHHSCHQRGHPRRDYRFWPGAPPGVRATGISIRSARRYTRLHGAGVVERRKSHGPIGYLRAGRHSL
jgi:hypothetical protein